jgi:hypothetical protein
MWKKFLTLALLVAGLAGCASVPMGDSKKNAELKTFATKPGVATLYVYRNESMGAAIKMDVSVDGKVLGQTAAKTYFHTELTPGKHIITSAAENTDLLEIDVVAEKLYFVWQEVKMGVLYARNKLQLVSEAVGKQGVLESNLAASK